MRSQNPSKSPENSALNAANPSCINFQAVEVISCIPKKFVFQARARAATSAVIPIIVHPIGPIATFNRVNQVITPGITSQIADNAAVNPATQVATPMIVAVNFGLSFIQFASFSTIGVIFIARFVRTGNSAVPMVSNTPFIVSFSILIRPSNVAACAAADPQNSRLSSASINF